ncbi:hypothetical protein [Enterococcus cecorum]|uniref:hypothetical protein n=1 Tax=Enterococcus cecorum TaxID=44008 RepID=UPI00148D775C|nr:hypothetical protein [Enterococcus cecorum]
MKPKAKRLYELINEIYNQSTYPLSQVEKQAFFEAAQKLTNNQERISLIAYRLYLTVEKAAQSHQSYKELQYLKKLLLKYRWKYYLGAVLPSSFIR